MTKINIDIPQAQIDEAAGKELAAAKRKIKSLEDKLRAAERREVHNREIVAAAKELTAVLNTSVLVDHYWED